MIDKTEKNIDFLEEIIFQINCGMLASKIN